MLTTKGRYAVMAILELAAARHSGKPVSLYEISNKQNITVNYLEQIFAKLKKANLVTSVKGPSGGYMINNNLADIRIIDIIDAVEENIEMTRCGSEVACTKTKAQCDTHHLWKGLSQHIRNYFNSITVLDVLSKKLLIVEQ